MPIRAWQAGTLGTGDVLRNGIGVAESATPLSNLHQPQRFITTHNASGQAIVHSHSPFTWSPYDNNNLAFAVPYTTSTFPADLNNDADIAAHEAVTASGNLGLVNPRGTVLRCVDFAPGYACGMHRTQSLDYGIVMEGEVDMVLDSGERHVLRRGDVAVQRATQHQWVNRSKTEWARMMFVLQDCKRLVVAGEEMGEDLGENSGLPPSGNSGE
ncbi:hypothetical protein B0I37DRAFT_393513 [Chaetomium sp. MPI-CAGE-AT-0009]|nr:hypothetical protein B0I37DRAFT_393513 [Chaetomium sp. MPI-CAGE-AT-0009]